MNSIRGAEIRGTLLSSLPFFFLDIRVNIEIKGKGGEGEIRNFESTTLTLRH